MKLTGVIAVASAIDGSNVLRGVVVVDVALLAGLRNELVSWIRNAVACNTTLPIRPAPLPGAHPDPARR